MDTAASRRALLKVRRFDSLEAMKDEEYAYWQSRPAHERLAAVSEIASEAYGLKGAPAHVSRLQRTLVHLKR